MIKTTLFGRAKPGLWHGAYNSDWHAAHPGAWERGELVSGCFYAGKVWGSSTLGWDRAWFARHGVKMPLRTRHVGANPNSVPLVST